MGRWRRSPLAKALSRHRGTIAYVIVVAGVLVAYLSSIKGCGENRTAPDQPRGATIIVEPR